MFKVLLRLVAALLFSLASQAHALVPTVPSWQWAGGGPSHPSAVAACQYAVNQAAADWVYTGIVMLDAGTGQCRASLEGAAPVDYTIVTIDGGSVCPPNSTPSGGQCACGSGFAESGGQCVASCAVGQGRTFNRTAGWARSSKADADDIVTFFGPPASNFDYDDGTCTGTLVSLDTCWRSQEPSAQGLYRLSCDHTMVITGPTTGSGDVHADPTNDNATCPGFVGQVNGKLVCVGTSSSPLPPDTAAPNVPTGAGNPSAGVKPSTGPGSGSTGAGRTPTTGSGGNDGGPASAAVGPGGTGDRDDGTPDPSPAVCGAPPLPACNVKVDETGTPAQNTSGSRFTPATTALNQQTTALQTELNKARDLSPTGWTWSFSFPTGCTPLVLAAFNDLEIDVCQWQPMIHDLMGMIWVIAGFFGFINLYRTSQGG